MVAPLELSHSRSYPLAVDEAFDAVLRVPLESIFARRYGPIPAVRSTEGPALPWGEIGQTRIIRLADGGSMREELTSLDRPRSFGYTLSELTGPMKPLASRVHGMWSFAPVGTGTRITWQWTVFPASALAVPLLPLFAVAWRGNARRSLDRLENLLNPPRP